MQINRFGPAASAELDDGNLLLAGYRKPLAWLVDGDPGRSGERLVPDNGAVRLTGVQPGPFGSVNSASGYR